ncbi:unnamed protein product [Gongylonema pulchrum]|uniref:SUEL-type lectin domain-containing protein n=1 Tax=Gongylonema pulchrum TaxID=637853 RepID=A0A183DFS2_9BILA|nr:unnamed protein product [Gongylonema pulchrum]
MMRIRSDTQEMNGERCDGYQRCSIPVNSEELGDPCPDTEKYLELQYECNEKIPAATTTTTTSTLPTTTTARNLTAFSIIAMPAAASSTSSAAT